MRLLFVDDDPSIVQMLETVVEALEPTWQTQSADSGSRALRLMEENRFDVIISDMGMPGMTGAQLLNEVMRRYPETSRILLSGYSEHDHLFSSFGITHQFLPKPFAIPAFQAALHRIRGLREMLRSEQLQKLLPRNRSLPALPAVYFKILETQQDPACSVERIAEVLSDDSELSAKILEKINGGSFTNGREVSTAAEAVRLLGADTIGSLAIGVHLFSAFNGPGLDGSWVDDLWRHSLTVAQVARKVALLETGSGDLAEQAFTAGLLHETGRLLFARTSSAPYAQLIARASQENKSLLQIEHEVLGATHAEVGGCLLHLWGLSTPISEAVAFQYEPSRATDRALSPLTVLHAANILEEAARSQIPGEVMLRLDSRYFAELGISDRLSVWQKAASEPAQTAR